MSMFPTASSSCLSLIEISLLVYNKKAIHVPKIPKNINDLSSYCQKIQCSLHTHLGWWVFLLLLFKIHMRIFSLFLTQMNTQSSLPAEIAFPPHRVLTRISLLFNNSCLSSSHPFKQKKNICEIINVKRATFYMFLFLTLQKAVLFYHSEKSKH